MSVNSGHLWKLCIVSIGVCLLISVPADATVYGWRNTRGVISFSNDLENVPESHRTSAQTFTSKLAGKTVPVETTTPAAAVEVEQRSAYERGLERGLQTAERQIALAGELARSVLTALPPPTPVRIVIQQAPQTIVRHTYLDHPSPFYGAIGPYSPSFSHYRSGYAYGFGHGRLVLHSHFFPGTRGRRRGLFFPHGHFSQDGFLFGHGVVVR